MVRKHLYSVRQNLGQLKIADVTSILCAIYLALILILLKLSEGLQGCRQAVPLLVHIVELVCEQEKIAEKLNGEVRVPISDLAICSKQAIKIELNFIPTFAGLVERMNYRKAVEWVIFKISLTHLLVRLASQSHKVAEFSILLQH